MDTQITRELRRIADDLDTTYARIADARIEQHMQEVKNRFVENFKKTHGLEHLDPEKIWNQMQDSIRQDLIKRPMDWRV